MTDFVPVSASSGVYRDETGKINENGEGMKEPLIPSKDRDKIEKYWGNDWMFAYVSDDVLKIIYANEGKVRKYFSGETGKIKKVVGGNCKYYARSIFVLMEDGSDPMPILAYVKESGEAYGWGSNEEWSMSDSYKSGWLDKPVKLKDNISRVFLADQMMLLLGENKTLYWCGNIWEGIGTSVFPVKSKKKK